MAESKDLLVVQTAFPGDILLSIPLLKQIRTYYPGSRITFLCRAGMGELFLRERLADEVFEVNKKDSASLSATLRKLRSQTWQHVFCPHESYRSAIWVRSLDVEGFTVGFRKWWNFWAFRKRLAKPMHLPDALRQLSLLAYVNPEFRRVWERDVVGAGWKNSESRTVSTRAREPFGLHRAGKCLADEALDGRRLRSSGARSTGADF
jgi:ADP-heptose:LPS heptosyltransferase